MEKILKINRAKAYYGFIIDEKTLIETLKHDTKFAKKLLQDNDYEVEDYLDESFSRDNGIVHSRIEIIDGSYTFIVAKNIMDMKDEQTLGEFKKDVHYQIQKVLLGLKFNCSVFNVPEEVYF